MGENDKVYVTPRADGEWGWRRVAANGEEISSGEGHRDATDATRAAMRACPDLAKERFVVQR